MENFSKIVKRAYYTVVELADRAKTKTGVAAQPNIDFAAWKGNPNTLTGKNRPLYAKHKLQKLGWKNFQAAAIVGNLMQESFSSLRTDVWGDKGTAFGVAQWRGQRLEKLRSLADSRKIPLNDLDLQIEYVDWELRNTERATGDLLAASTNFEQAVRAAIAYERPRGYTKANPENGDGFKNRVAYAQSLMENA